ncbi:hypothetical protein WJ972_01275 [Achromobacter insuavis]
MPTRAEAERFAIADRALARYDALIPAWEALGEPARQDVLRARIDRLHALHARVRMADVVREYEALRAQDVAVPRYALNDVASAYLYLRQPKRPATSTARSAPTAPTATTMPKTASAPRPACTTRWPKPRNSTAPTPSPTPSNRATRPGCTSRARPPAIPTTSSSKAPRPWRPRASWPTTRSPPSGACAAWSRTPPTTRRCAPTWPRCIAAATCRAPRNAS